MSTKSQAQKMEDYIRNMLDAVKARKVGKIDPFNIAYFTKGNTYVVASDPKWNDDGQPHDLFAVLPTILEGSHVIKLRFTVSDDIIDALRKELD